MRPSDPAVGKETARQALRLVVIQLVLGLVAGVGTALVSAQVGIGIVAGLVVFAISLQVQLLADVSRADVEARAKLRELGPVSELLELDKDSAGFLTELASAQARYLKAQRRLVVFDLELNHQRTELLDKYEECARGTLRLDLRPTSILRETDGVSTVARDLWATSAVAAPVYWDSPSGRAYLDQQETLLEAGIVIRRVFIEEENSLEDVADVVKRHLVWRERYGAAKADVRIALVDRLAPDLIADYAIVDGATVIRLELHRGSSAPVAVVWETSPAAVERAVRSYERLWQEALDPLSFALLQRDNPVHGT